MRNEIEALLDNEKYVVNDIKTLEDYGNERVYNIIIDYPEWETSEEYDKLDKHYQLLGDKLKALIDEELNSGDYSISLEAEFTTNNHYIFVVSELK